MRDYQSNNRGKLIDWLKIDSWIDSGLYSALTAFRDWWGAYSSFFGRFEVKGFWRACNELACEGLTLGVGGLLVVLTFALPAFEIAQGKINLSDEFSVTFLDRYGNEIGKRGLLRDDSVPLEEIPDHMIKATLATEDRRFFDHFGIDVMGTLRAMAENARADTVVQGSYRRSGLMPISRQPNFISTAPIAGSTAPAIPQCSRQIILKLHPACHLPAPARTRFLVPAPG